MSQVSAPRLADPGACRELQQLQHGGSSAQPLACSPHVAARTMTSPGPQPCAADTPAGRLHRQPPEGPGLEVAAPEPPPPRPECLTPGGLGSKVHCIGVDTVARSWAPESDRSGAGWTPIQQGTCILLLRRPVCSACSPAPTRCRITDGQCDCLRALGCAMPDTRVCNDIATCYANRDYLRSCCPQQRKGTTVNCLTGTGKQCPYMFTQLPVKVGQTRMSLFPCTSLDVGAVAGLSQQPTAHRVCERARVCMRA